MGIGDEEKNVNYFQDILHFSVAFVYQRFWAAFYLRPFIYRILLVFCALCIY